MQAQTELLLDMVTKELLSLQLGNAADRAISVVSSTSILSGEDVTGELDDKVENYQVQRELCRDHIKNCLPLHEMMPLNPSTVVYLLPYRRVITIALANRLLPHVVEEVETPSQHQECDA